MKTYKIRTFGCQMNERDSERMAALLEGMGYMPSEPDDESDIVVINTCSVRAKPEHKVYSELGRYKEIKKRKKDMVLVVTGCVAQQEGAELLRLVPHLDIVVGTRAIYRLPELVADVLKTGQRACAIDMDTSAQNGLFGAERPALRNRPDKNVGPTIDGETLTHGRRGILAPQRRDILAPQAFVVAMIGCSNWCAYCVVPRLRGPAISRSPEEIIGEVKDIASRGAREITLLGQNVNIYGNDLAQTGLDFPKLLRMVSEVDGVSRIRFVTSHPRDFSDRLIEEMAANPKVCEYLHLPAQAGSDKILKLMNRGYTRDQYLDLVKRIRKAIPDIALTADFIVGFPGESEDDFQQTLDLAREARYHNIYSFRYSPRPGTTAEKMKPDVLPEKRAERLSILQRLQDGITERIMKSYEGTLKEVLLEGPSKTDPSRTTGRSRCNIPVHVPGVLPTGRLVTVRITRALRHSLEGEMVS